MSDVSDDDIIDEMFPVWMVLAFVLCMESRYEKVVYIGSMVKPESLVFVLVDLFAL
jgi:hypothetical protein